MTTNKFCAHMRANGNGKELSKLLSAAVISEDFCRLLLTNPEQALNAGYSDFEFQLTEKERALILSIKAATLMDFASQMTNGFHQPDTHVNGHNGHA